MKLEKINTIEQANDFIKINPDLKPELWTVDSGDDTTDIATISIAKKVGEVFELGGFIYKLLDTATVPYLKVSYIYLNASELNIRSIDSIRNIIIARYKNGMPFIDLVKEYNMDQNPDGNFGWVSAQMSVKEFADAVLRYKRNDIFTVDVTSENWYYVVLKTFDDRWLKTMTLLKVKTGSRGN